MDTTLLRFTQDLNGQLQQRQLFYKELTKHQFAERQARFFLQRSMIYRTYETKVPNGDSKVTFIIFVISEDNKPNILQQILPFIFCPMNFLATSMSIKFKTG